MRHLLAVFISLSLFGNAIAATYVAPIIEPVEVSCCCEESPDDCNAPIQNDCCDDCSCCDQARPNTAFTLFAKPHFSPISFQEENIFHAVARPLDHTDSVPSPPPRAN